eukprot:5878627-Alexandrium_andersonii.AAC.1
MWRCSKHCVGTIAAWMLEARPRVRVLVHDCVCVLAHALATPYDFEHVLVRVRVCASVRVCVCG